MKFIKQANISTIKYSILVVLLLNNTFSFSQPSLALTINDLLNWQPTIIDQQNISHVPLQQRTLSNNYQVIPGLDMNTKILYCPDGMNNFGPYIDSANQFNLFNFSHWQYIDILAWFGGSASSPIIIPTKAWVDAAHKNGVKVIGTIFFAPTVYGGTQAAVQSFLQLDSSGNFIAASKLIDIANYYNFDGWILNFETAVNSATGNLAASFVDKLDSLYSGEVIWYDAMLANGSVSYQNKLDANNAYFFQHSTGLFTNYSWTSASTVSSSNGYAQSLGLSPYNVYTGADMWPTRNAQPAFTNYTWIDRIITNNVAKTSIALFATNFTFNYAPFSTFNTDSTDYNNFYATERKIFSGLDEDPFTADVTWKGLANYVPVRTTITSYPFESDFNTGHGLNYYSDGNILTAGSWHNMSHQAILPSWTFYKNGLTMNYDFTDAYSGGSSVSISSTTGGTYDIPLFSTSILIGVDPIYSELAMKSASNTAIDSIAIELKKSNTTSAISIFHPSLNGNWENSIVNHQSMGTLAPGDTIISINLIIYSSGAFTMNLGKIGLVDNLQNSVSGIDNPKSPFRIYPNPSNGIVEAINDGNNTGQLTVYDLKGDKVISKTINKNSEQQIFLPGASVYMFEFISGKEIKRGKLVVN